MFNLKQARLNAGLTQRDLAKRLGFISEQYISNMERGIAPIPAKHVPTIAAALKIPQTQLFTGCFGWKRELFKEQAEVPRILVKIEGA